MSCKNVEFVGEYHFGNFGNSKNSTAEEYRLLIRTFGEITWKGTSCRYWFYTFKKCDFDVEDKERGRRPKVYEYVEGLLEEDTYKTQE